MDLSSIDLSLASITGEQTVMPVSILVRFTVFLIALALAPIAQAQPAGGTIAGILRDSSGGAIPGLRSRVHPMIAYLTWRNS